MTEINFESISSAVLHLLGDVRLSQENDVFLGYNNRYSGKRFFVCVIGKLRVKHTVICVGKIVFTRCFLETVYIFGYYHWWIYEITNYAISRG